MGEKVGFLEGTAVGLFDGLVEGEFLLLLNESDGFSTARVVVGATKTFDGARDGEFDASLPSSDSRGNDGALEAYKKDG